MAINLPPIANPEKVGSFNTNFKMIQDELDNVIRRGGLGVGEPNHMEVDLDMNGNAILNASTDLGNSKSLITVGDADKRYLGDVSEDIAGKVDKAGDTMSGTLDMGGNFVRNLLAPTQDQDAATKAYVDQLEQSVMSLLTELHPFHFAETGDEIGGGIYCATHTNGTQTWHLIFAKQEGEAVYPATPTEWGNYGTVTGAVSEDDGLVNQNLVLDSFDDGSADAFYYCRDYVDGEGNNDYYLPSRNELACSDMLVALEHPDFTEALSAFRWTSTEEDSLRAWFRRFSDGLDSFANKNGSQVRVRPVRRVYI